MRTRIRLGGAWIALLVGIILTAGLFATGRLTFQWQPRAVGTAPDHGQVEKDNKKHEEEEGRVSGNKALLTTEEVTAAGIRAAPVETSTVAVALQTTGEVQVPDERQAQVTARVSGVVREVHKTRGDAVSVGTSLATIDSAELGDARAAYLTTLVESSAADRNVELWQTQQRQRFSARSTANAGGWLELDQALGEYNAAVSERAVAERNLSRMKDLEQRGLRSRTELLAAEADFERASVRAEATLRRVQVLGAVARNEQARARQRLEAARSKLRALGIGPDEVRRMEQAGADAVTSRFVVTSPIGGVVTDRQLTVGETVEATAKIFAIADLREVWVRAALYDRDLLFVRKGMAAVVRVQGQPDVAYRGRIVQLGPQIDEKTRTMPVRIAVTNRSAPGATGGWTLRPGLFVSADIETARKPGVVVPVTALQTINAEPVVFVETAFSEGAAYERRPVKVGVRDGDNIEVVEGLKPGERVVVANAYLLKSEFEKAKIGEGHAH